MKTVGVLALQGAVSEHLGRLRAAGCAGVTVRSPDDLRAVQALVIPGGESTSISRLILAHGLEHPIREFARHKPVFGTCAGLILSASRVDGADERITPLGLIDISVVRNGFGRQVDSFETTLAVREVGPDVPAVFIRAPYIDKTGEGVEVLAKHEGRIVAARSHHVLVTSFHPELTADGRMLSYFLGMIEE